MPCNQHGFYPVLYTVKETGTERTVPGPTSCQRMTWHSDRDKFVYPINAFILGARYVPKTILGAGDTEIKDTGAL